MPALLQHVRASTENLSPGYFSMVMATGVVFRRRLHTFSKVHCTMANRRSLLHLLGSGIVQSMP